jgi:hypothetical protein
MEMMKYRWSKTVMLLGSLIFATVMLGAIQGMADGRHIDNGLPERHEREGFYGDHKGPGRSLGERGDKGNETTGEIAAWLLGAANFTVALSILIKGFNRIAPLSSDFKGALTRFNHLQKKHLMRLHYFLNPVILGVALTHWLLSRCRSTSLPEWGLLVMALLMAIGVTLKLRLCPKTSIKMVHRLHTQPAAFLALIVILLIGHSIVDLGYARPRTGWAPFSSNRPQSVFSSRTSMLDRHFLFDTLPKVRYPMFRIEYLPHQGAFHVPVFRLHLK